MEWEERVLSSLNLAALQQVNKRRRASAAPPPPLLSPHLPPSPGGAGEGEGFSSEPTTPLGVAMAEAAAEIFQDFLRGGERALNAKVNTTETDGNGGEETDKGEQASVVDPPVFNAPPGTTAAVNPVRTETPRPFENPTQGESASRGGEEAGGGGGNDSAGAVPATNDGSGFVLVAKEHLVGTWLAVFVRASMLAHVTDVRSGKSHAVMPTTFLVDV